MSKEEQYNTFSHAVGILFALIAFPILWHVNVQFRASEDQVSFFIYAACFFFLFIASTSYHALKNPIQKAFLRKIDHISIYFMIAGTYTPFVIHYIPHNTARIFLMVMWTIVLLGTILKIFYTGRFEIVSLILYLGLGWMLVFIAVPFIAVAGNDVILFIALGGLLYTGGVYYYRNDDKPLFHFRWHLAVLSASIAHFVAVSLIV